MNKNLFLTFCALIACTSATIIDKSNSQGSFASSGFGDSLAYAIAIALFGAGVLFTLFGLKMFKAIIFILGFISVSSIVFALAVGPGALQGNAKGGEVLLGVLLAIVFGIGGGYLALCCQKVAVFLVGFACGSSVLFFLGTYLLGVSSNNGGIIVFLGLAGGIIGGILAVYINEIMIIIQTSLLGSGMIVYSLSLFKDGAAGFFKGDAILFTLLGIVIAAGGVYYQYKNRTDEKEYQRPSVYPTEDPMVIQVNAGPQIAYQQPFGAVGYPPQQGYGQPQMMPPQQGYGQPQNMPPQQGYGQPQNMPPQQGPGASGDYQRVV